MPDNIRIVHYVNQFFGGIGGEDQAGVEPQAVEGPVGPGRGINAALAGRGEVVATVLCGDNYFTENTQSAASQVLALIKEHKPDLVMAGPAFNAGRYGPACGEVCKRAQEELGIPAITGMYRENPGMELYRQHTLIVKNLESVRGMNQAINTMVELGLKLLAHEDLGKPDEAGYFARGITVDERQERNAAHRVIDMVLAKHEGQTIYPEIDMPSFDRVDPAPPIADPAKATIALVTDGGLVPKGNPDNFEPRGASWLGQYEVEGMQRLTPDEFQGNHSGYDTIFVSQDPNRLVPVDAARQMESAGELGKLHHKVFATAGVASPISVAQKVGQELAATLAEENVHGAILTST